MGRDGRLCPRISVGASDTNWGEFACGFTERERRARPRKTSFRHLTGLEEAQAGFPFSPSCYCYSVAVTDNLLSFLFWLDLRRRKVHHLFESCFVRAIKASAVCGEKCQSVRKPRQGASPSSAFYSCELGAFITPSLRSRSCPLQPC